MTRVRHGAFVLAGCPYLPIRRRSCYRQSGDVHNTRPPRVELVVHKTANVVGNIQNAKCADASSSPSSQFTRRKAGFGDKSDRVALMCTHVFESKKCDAVQQNLANYWLHFGAEAAPPCQDCFSRIAKSNVWALKTEKTENTRFVDLYVWTSIFCFVSTFFKFFRTILLGCQHVKNLSRDDFAFWQTFTPVFSAHSSEC